jgi:hypothetical protein
MTGPGRASSGPPQRRRWNTAKVDPPGWKSQARRATTPGHTCHGWLSRPVPVNNSIRPPVTEFGWRGHTLAGKVGVQPSSLTIGSRDDPRPRCLGLRPRTSRQLRRSHTRKRRPASSTGGAPAISSSPPAPSVGPPRLGRALTAVGGLAVHPRHCSARDRPRLAPPGLPTLLALEVPAPISGSPAARS